MILRVLKYNQNSGSNQCSGPQACHPQNLDCIVTDSQWCANVHSSSSVIDQSILDFSFSNKHKWNMFEPFNIFAQSSFEFFRYFLGWQHSTWLMNTSESAYWLNSHKMNGKKSDQNKYNKQPEHLALMFLSIFTVRLGSKAKSVIYFCLFPQFPSNIFLESLLDSLRYPQDLKYGI